MAGEAAASVSPRGRRTNWRPAPPWLSVLPPPPAWLRGRENLHGRCLMHVAGDNPGSIMRLLTGAGTPREFRAGVSACLAAAVTPTGGLFVLLTIVAGDQTAAVALSIEPDHFS